MTISATFSTAQITIFAIAITIVEIIKIILLIWIASAFSKVKRYTRLSANRTGQLCKLTGDTQILTRGIYRKLTENDLESKEAELFEQKIKKPKRTVAKKTAE